MPKRFVHLWRDEVPRATILILITSALHSSLLVPRVL